MKSKGKTMNLNEFLGDSPTVKAIDWAAEMDEADKDSK